MESIDQAQLERILASKPFAQSGRMTRFLRFTVEQTLEGRGGELKEYRIGLEVFDKESSYDPRIDPIVRVEARRLRAKLQRYYETDGRDDPVRIEFPTGSYVPVFRPRAAPAAPAATSGAIAVLPFANRSPNPEDEYFSDGLTDELIHALTKVEGLRVVARASVFQFKGKAPDLKEIGEKLSVGVVLEGSVRRSARRLRVSAQLVGVADGSCLWSETYEREMRDIFAIQDEISRAIVDTLRVRLVGKPETPLVRRHAEDLETYQLYLKGRHHCLQRTGEGLRKSIEYYEQALARDRSYALAWAGLSDSYSLLGHYGQAHPKQVFPKAKRAATRALRLDPGLAEAEASLAEVLWIFEWKREEAGRHFRRALELNPRDADALHWYGYDYLAALGRFDEAESALEQALQVDPLCLIIHASLGSLFLMRHQYDRAIEQFHKTLALDPNFFKAYTGLGRTYLLQGKYREAIECFRKGQSLSGGALYTSGGLGQSYAMAGQRGKAWHLVRRLIELSQKTYVQSTAIALVYIGLGEADHAFQWLQQAVRDHEAPLVFLKSYPAYDPLRSDPRFDALLRKIGLA